MDLKRALFRLAFQKSLKFDINLLHLYGQSGARRHDGREDSDQRPICECYRLVLILADLSTGTVSQARGSAYIEYGRTKIMAAW